MDTGVLRGFATRARTDLLREVRGRLEVVLGQGSSARTESPGAVAALERTVAQDGRETVADRVAYTWFNRIIALRFMDANGYTAAGVVSPEAGKATGQPQVLADAKGGDFDTVVVNEKVQAAITALLNGTRPSTDPQGEAYGLLLEAYCRYWNKAMPFMFEREGDYTELLMPGGLLATESVRDRAVKTLTEEACSEVEVIGWLYQFYISERKAEVFAGFKQNKKAGPAEIPAATQLFTPHWIVRYLVENSLGRLWLLNHPESRLAEQMDYYIKPVDEETDFLEISTPEELKIIDPAAGSGHMLTYAFDLLYAIYEEESYSPSEIPAKILEHNLCGVEIDPRAGALAAFALTMKATAKRKLFLKNPVQPNICVLQNIHFEQPDLDYLWTLTTGSPVARADLDAFWNAFLHADTFGSLIQPDDANLGYAEAIAEQLEDSGSLLAGPARRVIAQSKQLSQSYCVVLANPPYMGNKNLSPLLAEFASTAYPMSKVDLYAMFIERCAGLAVREGLIGMITMQSWMFLSTFAALRVTILEEQSIVSMVHLGTGAFDTIGGDVVATTAFVRRRTMPSVPGVYIALSDLEGEANQANMARNAINGADPNRLHRVPAQDLAHLPLSSMAYWLSDEERSLYLSHQPLSAFAVTRQGLATGDNARFVRYWWEVSARRTHRVAANCAESVTSGAKWFPMQKGGTPRRWTGNDHLVVNWTADGAEIRSFGTEAGGRARSRAQNTNYYFRAGATWSTLAGDFAVRHVPSGSIFETKGSMLFPNQQKDLTWLLGYLNTPIARSLIDSISPTLDYHEGPVGRIPVVPPQDFGYIAERVDEVLAHARRLWAAEEPAWSFAGLPAGEGQHSTLAAWAEAFVSEVRQSERTILRLEREMEAHFRYAARLSDQAFRAEQRPTGLVPAGMEDGANWSATFAADAISYAVGCMFGRYSLNERGLILGNQGDSLQDYLASVPTPSLMPDLDNVIPILDGDWFEDDIVAKFRHFLRVTFGEEHFEENLKFVIDSLGVKDLRDYFVRSFYKDHVQRYKKRPVYWLFSSPKGSFNALVYLHRYNPSTVSIVLNEYLREYIKKLEVSLEQQEYIVTSGASAREVAAAQREADRLHKVLLELSDYERDLFALASRQIPLDLDDGVLVNYQKLGTALKDIGLKKAGNDE